MYRHGDVMIAPVAAIPHQAKPSEDLTLAEGELTGHSHRIEDPTTAEAYSVGQQLFLRVIGQHARVVHEEHNPIDLPRGVYRVWRQREYTPQSVEEFQYVMD